MKMIDRILFSLAVACLIPLYFVPIWRIDLIAPQYPEGVGLKIWLTKLSGDVNSINNLNHYIGMAAINEEQFPEFVYLPYILGSILLFGVGCIIAGRQMGYRLWVLILCLFGLGAMIDMYRWGYQYGHNLDPHAAIKIEGIAYQPPLIGYKQLLNFEAYSLPDIGGYLLAISLLLCIPSVLRRSQRVKNDHLATDFDTKH